MNSKEINFYLIKDLIDKTTLSIKMVSLFELYKYMNYNPAGNYLYKVRKNNIEMILKVLQKQMRKIFFQLIVRPIGPDSKL